MHFSTLALFSLASGALAAPAAHGKRDDGIPVYFCTDINFNPYCDTLTAPVGICIDLPDRLNNKVGSLAPPENVTCTFYKELECKAGTDAFYASGPGYWDLKKVSVGGLNDEGGPKTKNFNKKVSSFEC
ncbi:hypothetical protein T440DRAFT_557461 [Plenodomus tracheiphilus IPT5]|uniref:Uncharacterized protein n=1 Tax=Plenodomus tracheiphilus IPT5 TaxID=1408161 RepID=A0A6A7AYW8_9PLEO|nr:hypothetical protein T440DRAFT_557461 [Plenodomus tracheiphilus IPT5]